jgi:hypothetical protein
MTKTILNFCFNYIVVCGLMFTAALILWVSLSFLFWEWIDPFEVQMYGVVRAVLFIGFVTTFGIDVKYFEK